MSSLQMIPTMQHSGSKMICTEIIQNRFRDRGQKTAAPAACQASVGKEEEHSEDDLSKEEGNEGR
jgi:hypothetical protein